MSVQHTINAEVRADAGKGASRRLRRDGKVPAVIYGGHKDPVALSVVHDELRHAAQHESFYASIIEIKVRDDASQQAVVRDMQRHPYRPLILHIDFMRVSADEVLRIAVPIHFIGEDKSPAGKASGVVIQHLMTEVEIEALPKDLPEFLAADLSQIEAGDSVFLSDIQLPEGVRIPALQLEGDYDMAIAHAVHVKESQGTDADILEAVPVAEVPEAEAAEAEEKEEKAEGDEAQDEKD